MVEKLNFRSFDPVPPGENSVENERRFRAGVERAFAGVDDVVSVMNDVLLGASMLWRGAWVSGSSYRKNDVVRDGDWTMIANRQTEDRPSPQPVGDPDTLYDGSSPSTSASSAQIVSGQDYLSNVDPFFITGYRLFRVAGVRYQVILVRNVGTPDEQVSFVNSFTATSTGWLEFNLSPRIVPAGVKFRVLVIATPSAPVTVTTNANYSYEAPPGLPGPPAAGQALQYDRATGYISFHKTDDDAIDRSSLLTSLKAGDRITTDASTPSVSWVVQAVIDQGAYVDVFVAPAVQEQTDGTFQFSFDVVTQEPITFMRDTDYWLTNTPPNATIKGLFLDGGNYEDVVEDDTAYGVDLLVQRAIISPDWDLVAVSGGSGASGTPSQPATTGDAFPLAPSPGDLHYLTVSPIGLYIFVDDGTSKQWVQSNGGGGYSEFYDPADIGSYFIQGRKLECWGITAASGTGVSVVFPKVFVNPPAVTMTPIVTSATDRSVAVSGVTTTGFTARQFQQSGAGAGGNVYWRAVGEWDGVS